MHHADFGLLVLRVGVGVTLMLHGYAKIFLGGKLTGTARWFESIGLRPGWAHARAAASTEIVCGGLFTLGFLTPLAAAGIISLMLVAGLTSHRGNGFYIYRPGEGWEYVMVLGITVFAVATIGPGDWSVDHAIGWDITGWSGALLAGLIGLGGGALFLAAFWRRPAKQVA